MVNEANSNTPIYSLVMMQLQARPAFKSELAGFALFGVQLIDKPYSKIQRYALQVTDH